MSQTKLRKFKWGALFLLIALFFVSLTGCVDTPVNQYTVTYQVAGEADVVETYNYGDAITIRADLVKEGYTFAWDPVSLPATMPAENLVVNGAFTPITYNITYVLNGGTHTGNPETYTIETPTITLAPASKDGHTFDGWFIGETKVTEITLGSTGDKELTAKFTLITHDVTVTGDGVTTDPAVLTGLEVGTDVVFTFAKEGHTLTGLTVDGVSVLDQVALGQYTLTVAQAHEVVVTWTVNQYTVTYQVPGEADVVETYNYGDAITIRADLVKEGYTFAWNPLTLPSTMPAENIEVIGTFTPIVYTITYNGLISETHTNPFEYTVEDSITLTPPSGRDGYVFKGWFDGETKVNTIVGSTGHLVLEAKWEEKGQVEGTILKYEGSSTTNMVVDQNNASIVNLDQTIFDVRADAIGQYNNVVGLNADGTVRLYANRSDGEGNTLAVSTLGGQQIKKLIITFAMGQNHVAGETSLLIRLGDQEIILDSSKISDQVIEYDDLDISSFSLKNTTTGSKSGQIWITSIQIEYEGGTPLESHEVDFDLGYDGLTLPSKTVVDNEKVVKPVDPTREGHVFLGWFLNDELFDFDTLITEPIILLAKWEELFTVTVVGDGYTTIPENLTNLHKDSEVTFKFDKLGYEIDIVLVDGDEVVVTDSEFTLVVTANHQVEIMWKDSGMTDAEIVALAKADLEIELETSEATIDLPTSGLFDTTITWASSDVDIIDPVTGIVAKVESDTLVILTATIKLNDAEDTKLFEVLVVAEGEVVEPESYIETFDAATNLPTGNNYGEGTFTGVENITWSYHGQAAGEYEIDGNGFLLRRASDSYLEATFPNGIKSLSFDYRKAYTGGTARQLEVLINGEVKTTSESFGSGSGVDATVYNLTVEVNVEEPVTVRIKLTGTATTNRHAVIDNFTWTEYSDVVEPVKDDFLAALDVETGKLEVATVTRDGDSLTVNFRSDVSSSDVLAGAVGLAEALAKIAGPESTLTVGDITITLGSATSEEIIALANALLGDLTPEQFLASTEPITSAYTATIVYENNDNIKLAGSLIFEVTKVASKDDFLAALDVETGKLDVATVTRDGDSLTVNFRSDVSSSDVLAGAVGLAEALAEIAGPESTLTVGDITITLGSANADQLIALARLLLGDLTPEQFLASTEPITSAYTAKIHYQNNEDIDLNGSLIFEVTKVASKDDFLAALDVETGKLDVATVTRDGDSLTVNFRSDVSSSDVLAGAVGLAEALAEIAGPESTLTVGDITITLGSATPEEIIALANALLGDLTPEQFLASTEPITSAYTATIVYENNDNIKLAGSLIFEVTKVASKDDFLAALDVETGKLEVATVTRDGDSLTVNFRSDVSSSDVLAGAVGLAEALAEIAGPESTLTVGDITITLGSANADQLIALARLLLGDLTPEQFLASTEPITSAYTATIVYQNNDNIELDGSLIFEVTKVASKDDFLAALDVETGKLEVATVTRDGDSLTVNFRSDVSSSDVLAGAVGLAEALAEIAGPESTLTVGDITITLGSANADQLIALARLLLGDLTPEQFLASTEPITSAYTAKIHYQNNEDIDLNGSLIFEVTKVASKDDFLAALDVETGKLEVATVTRDGDSLTVNFRSDVSSSDVLAGAVGLAEALAEIAGPESTLTVGDITITLGSATSEEIIALANALLGDLTPEQFLASTEPITSAYTATIVYENNDNIKLAGSLIFEVAQK